MALSYRKTRNGDWAVFGPYAELKAGRDVTVTKKDGRTKSERILNVSKAFLVDGVQHVYGFIAQREVSAPAPSAVPDRVPLKSIKVMSGKCSMRGCQQRAGASGLCKQCHFDEYDN